MFVGLLQKYLSFFLETTDSNLKKTGIFGASYQKHKNAFLACFRAYVGQPHGQIHWATSMPFPSINPTNPIYNIFAKKFWESGILKNSVFFEFEFWIFCFFPMKISPNLYGRMDGSKFWCFSWFPKNSLLCVILRYTVHCSVWLISIWLLSWKSLQGVRQSSWRGV